jgi:hypothetical protein
MGVPVTKSGGVEDFQPLQGFRLPMLVFHQLSKKKKIFCTV